MRLDLRLKRVKFRVLLQKLQLPLLFQTSFFTFQLVGQPPLHFIEVVRKYIDLVVMLCLRQDHIQTA